MFRRVTITALCVAGMAAIALPTALSQAEDPSQAEDDIVITSLPEGISARSLAKIARAKKKTTRANKKKKQTPGQNLKKVCKSVSPIRMLFKPAWGGHIGNGDSRTSGPAVVCSRSQCPRAWPAPVYYSDGSLAFRVGVYGRWSGNGQPRAYCASGGASRCDLRGAARNARAKGRDGKLYIALGGGACASIANPLGRNGSPF